MRRRGVSEIIGVLFAIFVIVALVLTALAIFNAFRETSIKALERLELAREVLHSHIGVVNFSLTSGGSEVLIKLSPRLSSLVDKVICRVAPNSTSQIVVHCTHRIASSSLMLLTLPAVNWSYAYVDLVLHEDGTVELPLYGGSLVLKTFATPGVAYPVFVNETFVGNVTLSIVFLNNSTGWACVNTTLALVCVNRTGSCYINGTGNVTVLVRVLCVEPLGKNVVNIFVHLYCEHAPCEVYANVTYVTLANRTFTARLPVVSVVE